MNIRKGALRILSAVIVAFVALSVLTVSVSAQGPVIKGEPDGQSKTTAMQEHFYSGTLEPSFTSDTVSVKTDSYAMHFAGAYQYGSGLVLMSYKLKDYNRFTYSMDCLKSNDGMIYMGFGGKNESDEIYKYDGCICITKSVTVIYEMGGSDMKVTGESCPLSNAFAPGKTTNFAFTLERVSGKNFKITFELIEDGEVIATTDYGTTMRLNNDDGYICFWNGQGEEFNMRDFKAYDAPNHVAYADNFKNSTLTYGDERAGDSNWHINNSNLTSEDVYICRNAGPEFKKANDAITAKSKLETCDQVSKPYEITFDTKFDALSKDATFGLFVGAKSAGNIQKSTVIGVSTLDSRFASVNLIKNGKILNSGEDKIPLDKLEIGTGTVTFKAVINSDNSITLTIADVEYRFYNIDYAGYWGICSYSTRKGGATTAKVDQVIVVRNVYTPCPQEDLFNNFGGIKMTPDGFEDYYINDRSFYLGPGVALRPNGAFTEEPSLYFEQAGPYSAFSPKQKYTDFILQFDVKMVSEGSNGKAFGVSFGRSSFAAIAPSSVGVAFAYNGWTDTPYSHISANNCIFADGTREMKIEDYHFYKDTETKYNFMIVAKNRTVYVYFKKDSEDITKLGICRAIIPNVNTAGYVAIYGDNGISFDVFNYRLTNLAAEATADSDIALRESFEKEQISDKLVTAGSAAVKDGAMQLSGGSVSLKNKTAYFILDFTVLKSKADLTVNFAKNCSVTFLKGLKKISVNEGGKQTVFDVSDQHLADYKNVRFEMILQYDGLSIAARGLYDPSDKVSLPIVEYTFANPLTKGTLKLNSNNAVIDDLSVCALDDSYEATNTDYEDDPNDTEMWFAKDKIVGQKAAATEKAETETVPLAYIIAYAVIGAVIIALLVVIIVISIKKRGKKAQ